MKRIYLLIIVGALFVTTSLPAAHAGANGKVDANIEVAVAVIHGTIHHVPHRNQQSHAFEVLPGTSENSEDFCGRHSETTEQIPPLASQQILRC